MCYRDFFYTAYGYLLERYTSTPQKCDTFTPIYDFTLHFTLRYCTVLPADIFKEIDKEVRFSYMIVHLPSSN